MTTNINIKHKKHDIIIDTKVQKKLYVNVDSDIKYLKGERGGTL